MQVLRQIIDLNKKEQGAQNWGLWNTCFNYIPFRWLTIENNPDVCCLKMTALNCSIYHKFLKALVYKKDHHAKSGQRLQIRPKKYFLLQKRDWRQTICRFRVIESTCCTHESPGWKPDRLQVRSLLSSEWLKRELKMIFSKVWLPIGRSDTGW